MSRACLQGLLRLLQTLSRQSRTILYAIGIGQLVQFGKIEFWGIGAGHKWPLQGIKLSHRTTFCSEPIFSTRQLLHCKLWSPKKIGSSRLGVSSTASTNHGPTNSFYIISGTHFIQKFKAYGWSFHASCVAAFLVYCCHQVWRRRETPICPCFTFSSSEEKPMWQEKQICFTVTSSDEKPMTDRWNTGRFLPGRPLFSTKMKKG